MTGPSISAGAVELAVVERGGLIESAHLGHAIVLAPDGSVLATRGDADAVIYPRSSLKPLQAIAVQRLGLDLRGEELALATASHRGNPEHIRVVGGMLGSVGLDESALQCPADPTRLAMNCSGKHAAFLTACIHQGWPIEDYLAATHPLQAHILATIAELCGEEPDRVTVDGCGAPLAALSLGGLARGLWRAVQTAEGKELVAAVTAHPWAIDGVGGANTVAIERLGLFAKGGAEGVLVMVAEDGTTVALKVIDGSARATTLIGLSLLAESGAVDQTLAAEVADQVTPAVLGGGEVVGRTLSVR